MSAQDQFNKFIRRYQVTGRNWIQRRDLSRRQWLQLAGGVAAAGLGSATAQAQNGVRIDKLDVKTINRAKNVIFILLDGAPSHVDLFDLKVMPGVTPASFKPETINGVLMPTGILPKLTEALPDYAIVRSMRSWALVHGLAQTWTQIGRNPTSALGDIAPSIGSIVAIEKQAERTAGQVFPTFLALNASSPSGSGYLPGSYGPFKVTPSTAGVRNTTNVDGEARFKTRYDMLLQMDATMRQDSPLGKPVDDYADFYDAARGLTYNPTVDATFRFTAADRAPYGASGFGDACLVAQKALRANAGTRFIHIRFGGWDDHAGIYDANRLPARAKQLDDGLAQLIKDLKASGLYDSTLIVMAGEFGRTVGRLSAAAGRDHYLQQFCFLGGAGIKGGRVIGATDAQGASTTDPGWSAQRDVKPEDIEATIYSAMGINWTSIRYDDPFNRGFEYVPYSHDGLYQPLDELWK